MALDGKYDVEHSSHKTSLSVLQKKEIVIKKIGNTSADICRIGQLRISVIVNLGSIARKYNGTKTTPQYNAQTPAIPLEFTNYKLWKLVLEVDTLCVLASFFSLSTIAMFKYILTIPSLNSIVSLVVEAMTRTGSGIELNICSHGALMARSLKGLWGSDPETKICRFQIPTLKLKTWSRIRLSFHPPVLLEIIVATVTTVRQRRRLIFAQRLSWRTSYKEYEFALIR